MRLLESMMSEAEFEIRWDAKVASDSTTAISFVAVVDGIEYKRFCHLAAPMVSSLPALIFEDFLSWLIRQCSTVPK